MDYKIFKKLYQNAKESPNLEMYIGERGYEKWMESYLNGSNAENVTNTLTNIYNMANMTLTDIRECAGLSRAEFSRIYKIPVRTLENWEYDTRKLNEYIKMLIIYTLLEETENGEQYSR